MKVDIPTFVQAFLVSLQYACYVVLAFYVFRVLVVVSKGKKLEESHRLREAMALGYTAVAAYFIVYSTRAIQLFANSVLDVGTPVNAPAAINLLVVICAGLICFAFICNFCRSLWMLKLLDHGIFEPVEEWEKLTDSTPSRLVEFIPRTLAAILFICLESKLEKLGDFTLDDSLTSLINGSSPPHYLTQAGVIGLALYGTLIVWWLLSRFVLSAAMPWSLLIFHGIGLVNSGFISLYGGEPVGAALAWGMFLIISLMACGAAYMIFVIIADIVKAVSQARATNNPSIPNGTNSANPS